MRLHHLLLAGVLSSAHLFAAGDPFVGTWVSNREKSPKPTIRYEIKDLGGDRFSLTGSTGQVTTIKADGMPIQSAYGGTVSFRKLDDHNWQMIRKDPEKMVRTYMISPDDKTLTLHDVFTGENGKGDTTTTVYERLAPGKSIFGKWQSVSMKVESMGDPGEIIIEPYGKDGLSFTSSSNKSRLDMNFDGKPYVEKGPDVTKGSSTSGKRVNAHLLESEDRINGEPDGKEEWKISQDGKTMTIIYRPVKSSAVFTSVFDKR